MKALVFLRPLIIICLFLPKPARTQSISGVINNYYQVTGINTASNTLTLNTTSGLSVGTKVLVIQMKGATIDATNSSTYGNITAVNNAGNYEFNYICNISGNNVILQYQLLRSYTVSAYVQVVSVPVYSSVTVSGTLSATPWSAATGTGGVVAFEAKNTIFLNANIDVSGQGFAGGALFDCEVPPFNCSFAVNVNQYFLPQPNAAVDQFNTGGQKGEGIADYIANEGYGRGKLSNGGGGGNNNNTGGAGGGNYGTGGNGGQRTGETLFSCHGTNPGVGGLSLSAFGYSVANNRIYLGGGGGAGHENNNVGMPGANGGGIVIITAPLLSGSGSSILANGSAPYNASKPFPTVADGDGGGGGGAGGTVILNVNNYSGSIPVQTIGGRGSDASNNVNDCTGPGGGGAGGVIWTSGASFPAAIAASVVGGSNGVVSATSTKVPSCAGSANSATPGTNGSTQTGYVPPVATSPVCALLPVSALQYFDGKLIEGGAELSWGMSRIDDILSYGLEFSFDRIHYSQVAFFNNDGSTTFDYQDMRRWEGTIFYRLKLSFLNGSISYSPIVPISRNEELSFNFLGVQPNPASSDLNLVVFSKTSVESDIILYSAYGQRLLVSHHTFDPGYSTLHVDVANLSSGVYFIMIRGKGIQATRQFVKNPY
ncbi:MAG: hypothetical protein C5B59_05195 [Bacteroidetes bacterium]|nr:MAG: hypothetical protein C5B59_05195 [Bacteroidota bacterium]